MKSSRGLRIVAWGKALSRHGRLAGLLLALGLCGGLATSAHGAEPDFVGVLALAIDDEAAANLELSDEQRAKLLAVIDQREDEALELALEIKDLPPAERADRLAPFRRESERLGLAVLDEQQREKLRALGAKLPSDREDSSSEAAQAETAQPEPSDEQPASTDGQPVAGESGPSQAAGNGRLQFNFRFQPWSEVLDWFAQQADLSLVMDAPPPGTLNYTDSRGYTPAEAIDLLNSVLLTKGYTLIRRDRMLMVINVEDGIPPNLVPRVPLEELDDKGEFELVSVLFPLEKMTTEEAAQEISTLIGPQGSVVKLPKAQQVLVTETAGRLRTIRSVIEGIEDPEGGGGLRVFQLKSITLDSAMKTLRQLLDIPADGNATMDGSLRLALEPAGNRLLVRGQADKVARLAEIIKAIDVAGSGGGGLLGETPQLEVYSISSADPTAVLEVLQTLLAGRPDVRLAIDSRTGNLVAHARPGEHATIRATIAQMQRDGSKVEVIRLSRLDPQLAVLAINKLFGAEGSANAPKVDAEPVTRQLLVRGSEAQIAQIRGLLEKMGEGDSAAGAVARGGNVRMLPLSGRAARAGLALLEQVWPTLYQNKIRIVTPSAVGPALRQGDDSSTPRRRDLLRGLDPTIQPSAPAATPERLEQRRERDDEPPESRATTGREARQGRFRLAQETRVRDQVAVADEAGGERPLDQASDDGSADDEASGDVSPDSGPLEDGPLEDGPLEDGPLEDGPLEDGPLEDGSLQDGSLEDGADDEPPPIVVAPGPGGTMIASEDLDALDVFESLLSELASRATSGGKEFTIFYLKSATAAVVAETLGNILGGGSVSRGGPGGSLLGNIAGAALGEGGGGMMGALMGLGQGGGDSGGPIVARGVLIVPDHRLNALVVEGSPNDLDTIEQLLEVLDQEGVPETLVASRPRMIPVIHTKASDVADVIKQVYQDRLTTSAGAQRQPSPEDFIRMLRGGGRRGQGGGGGGDSNASEPQKMAIGVDVRTNSIVISAPQPLFEEVEQLVQTLDQVTENTTQAVRVVTLRRSNTSAVQQALQAIVGGTSQTARSSDSRGGQQASRRDGDSPRGPDPEQMERIRQRMEFFNNMQQGRGGFGGGGFGGRGFGGGDEGGNRGGRGGNR
ncbi:MAG: secretin N-terminal domain-containing protein [Pirellulales bacterium]